MSEDQDHARIAEQSLRYRLLTGDQLKDVREEIEGTFCKELSADLTINPDLSKNPFKTIYNQLNTAYLEAPEVTVRGGDEEIDLSTIVTSRLWSQQVTTGLYTLAMGEALVRVDLRHWIDAQEVSYRVIPPHRVRIEALPFVPDMPGMVEESRPRDGVMTFETWDIRDPAKPIFKIEEMIDGVRVDMTVKYAPDLAAEYPYRDTSGAPILPYVLYHKKVSSQLWHWSEGRELSKGTLRLSALASHWSDAYTSAAHPQRWALDVDTPAGITRNVLGVPVEVIPTDRKSIIRFNSKGPNGGSLGSFTSAFDPLASAEALRLFESSLSVYAGLNPADLQITSGAQSGYAIVVSRDGQRRQQRRITPALTIADQMLLATAAKLSNFYLGTTLSEEPREYVIRYRALGPTADEIKATTENLKAELELGTVSQIDVIRGLHPEIESEAEALERLLHVRRIERDLTNLPLDDDDTNAAMVDTATVLNGAQVTAAQGIVQAVAAGLLPRDSGVQMLAAFFGLPQAAANAIMGSVGATFQPTINSEG
tara:strand:+ start:4086 stop:5699 length:1614 start_codon:yes stop_codon:yes gene_type:complete